MTYLKTGSVYQRLPTFASMTSFLGKSNAHINLLKTSYVFQRLPTFTKVSSITGLKKGLKKSNAFDLFEDR